MKRMRELDSSDESELQEENKAPREESSNESESDHSPKSFPVVLRLGGNKHPPGKTNQEDEDEFQISESNQSSSSSDEFSEEFQRSELRKFVVHSDEDERPRRSRVPMIRAPTRTSRRLAASGPAKGYGSIVNEDSEEDDLRAELRAELRDLRSPSPQRRELRAKQRVNYRILPPPQPESVFRGEKTVQGTGGRAQKRTTERRLFPVAGPFGGNDVVSIFKPGREEFERTLKELKDTASSSTGNNLVSNASNTLADSDPLGIETNIDFSAIGGLEDYIDQLKEMVTLPLMYPELYKRFGITPPRGVLFHGPPGTGKTLMARALASMGSRDGRKITFFMRKGGDCLSKWVGEAERQLRVLFDEAKEKQPSIIFFDEIDGLAPVRSSKQEQIHASIVSTLLALMDGLDNRGQVVVIGATNRPDNIDPALRRPGRFDREFFFPLPNAEARRQIVKIHTKRWNPPLEDSFVDKISELTKGYGGADIKALCTESALNAIQRSYPQIYASEKKLVVHPEKISVSPSDVIKALERILPSTVRGATGSTNAPLPPRILPLIKHNFDEIKHRLDVLMPKQRKMSPLEAASYNVGSFSFEEQQQLQDFKTARVNRPRLLIHGATGNGQEYIGSAILNYLEGVSNYIVDLGSMFSDSIRTPEAAIIQTLLEAKKRSPSVVLIPNIEMWFSTISTQAQSIFFNSIRSFSPTDRVLIIGIANTLQQELEPELKQFFGTSACKLHISTDEVALMEFFKPLFKFITSSPTHTMDLEDREKRPLPELPVAHVEEAPEKVEKSNDTLQSEQEKKDNRTRSQLKVKLGSLMDMFQKRYRRFKKPVVEDDDLLYLFMPPADEEVEREYVKTDDDKIMEVASGKKYHNMDLDIVEDRLWNGYYCEPRQFLQDLELIHEDSLTLGDRDRIHKSSEMVANAQVAIDDIDSVFITACRDLRRREAEKQLKDIEGSALEDEDEGPENSEAVEKSRENGIAIPAIELNGGPHESFAKSLLPANESDMEMDDVSRGQLVAPMEQANEPIARPVAPQVDEPVAVPTPQASEPSPETAVEDQGVVTYDQHKLENFRQRLFRLCTNVDLDQLEVVFSSLADSAWGFRCDWDRTAMTGKLLDTLSDLEELLV